MERYHIYKLGIAILFYAIYCRRPMVVNGLEVDDVIGTINNKSVNSEEFPNGDYYVYYQGVQGKPGVDFPVFSRIPRTSFSCKDVETGYYADLETDCQVFHICNEGIKVSFLCPNGTIFQQSDLICDWWFKVNCTNSPNLYEESAEQLREAHIRRKASRRVLNPDVTFSQDSNQFADRKMDLNYNNRGTNRYNKEINDESQITQETASFYNNKGSYNNIESTNKNSFPTNHRTTYSDIQDPRNFYTNFPTTSSASPQVLIKNPLNNGQPFIVSTPKLGASTQRSTFKYSPTIPTTVRTTSKPKSTSFTPKPYNNLKIETFTNPPTVNNGKSTVTRKPKTKNSFTIGLNSVQGPISFKTQTTQKPSTTQKVQIKKNSNVIKLSLSSDLGAKTFRTKGRAYDPNQDSKIVRVEKGPLKLSLNTDLVSTPRSSGTGFFVTKGDEFGTSPFNSGSITGSKNTYIPTTLSPIFTTQPSTIFPEYHSNTFGFVKPTGIPKPKPFQLPLSTTTSSPYIHTTDPNDYFNPTILPNYQISSASPFTIIPPILPSSYTGNEFSTIQSTYPTLFTTTVPPLSENVHNMLDTLKEIANVRTAKEEDFDASRPGLIIPPSVGPQTLHTLAVYFANALDNLVPSNETESTTEGPNAINENLVINSLLSKDTVHKYRELFMKEDEDEEEEKEKIKEEDEDNDLDHAHSNNAVQSPRVRQLAKVFTQALSSYLDDPDMFRKVLQEIRPTEPPPVQTLPTENGEEDELLNFSDADIKPENPRLPTPAPANPTWGYILAFNTSNEFKTNHVDNDVENLQSADSQSFVPGFNDITTDPPIKGLPANHWTSSPGATKLWQTTLYVNPLALNQKLDTTNLPELTSSTEGGEDFDDDSTPKTETYDTSADLSEYVTESVIDYELRSLPKLNLNSTEVHGILIDFMNSTKQEGDGSKFQRILSKLNTTEEEFLNKMKEIEKNPITRRLILLLVNECGNKTFETKVTAVRDIINLANSESLQHSSSNVDSVIDFPTTNPPQSNQLSELVDHKLKNDDQDSRALQLLNSLYSIASKYGK